MLTIGILVPSLSFRFGIRTFWFAIVARYRVRGIGLRELAGFDGSVEVIWFRRPTALAVMKLIELDYKLQH